MVERILVAGGGLAGLTAARHLAADGFDVQVIERRDTVGGRVRTDREDGFLLDRGFQVLFPAYPAVRRELDLGALDLRRFEPGATIARPGERSVLADPLRAPRRAPASLANREVSVADKLRTLRLRLELTRRDWESCFAGPDESIRSYLRGRGFSERFVGNFAAPFYGGITLDRSLSTSRAVFEYTFKAMAEGPIAVPAGGMGAIPDQLAAGARDAGATVETDAAVEAVTPRDSGGVSLRVEGAEMEADAAVVATDPPTAGELTGVDAIPTDARGCVTQYFTLPRPAPGGEGRLVLNAGGTGPNHVAPLSAVAPEYAPDGRALLSAVFLGDPDPDDAELAERTRAALASWYPERGFGDLALLRTDRIRFAQFEQPPGFREGLPDASAPEGDVFLAGDYTRWSSIDAAIESGRATAAAVRTSLRSA
ncbi:MAG: NAD(P)/FAD-dependent oxidoreductase [Halobacteriales archaeon]